MSASTAPASAAGLTATSASSSSALATGSSVKSLCSIRDAEQGVYEYLAEKHEPAAALALRAFSVPVRLSGWLWRREGLFRRPRKRFCVFDATRATLSVFASDDAPEQRRQLARFVVTHVALQAERAFVVQGYVREREIHRGHAAALARRRSSLPALPGDEQHFFLPETETLRAVSDKSARVWSHCFRNHRKAPARLRRLRRRWRRFERFSSASGAFSVRAGGGAGSDGSDDTDEDEADDDDTDEDVNPNFQFEEPERQHQQQRRRQLGDDRRRRHFSVGGDTRSALAYARRDDDSDGFGAEEEEDEVSGEVEAGDDGLFGDEDPRDRLVFDQERNLRITTSYQVLPSTTFFESERESTRMDVLELAAAAADPLELPRVQPMASSSSILSFTDSHHQHFLLSSANSIWTDEELLSFRVDFDAIRKKRQLSVGAFGEVWLAEYRSAQRVAVKHLRSTWSSGLSSGGSSQTATRQDIHNFLREIKIMCKLTHERIVSFLGVAWTMERDVLLMMEFVPGGDLRSYLDRVKRSDADADCNSFRGQWTWSTHQWRVAIDVAEALVYLHSLSPALLHCDVKSHNVLLSSDLRAKVTDFGISRYLPDDGAVDPSRVDAAAAAESGRSGWDGLGTGRWMAPEVLTGAAGYSIASDVYAFGVLLSEIDTCAMPFSERIVAATSSGGAGVFSEDVLVHRIVNQEWTPALSAQCPDAVRALAQRCFASDPKRRPTSLEVAYRLRKTHASLRENGADLRSLTCSGAAA